MTGKIQTSVEAVNDLLKAGVTGILEAYDYPPDNLPDEKVFITYYGGGTANTESAGMTKKLFSITSEFHVFRKDLSRDVKLIMDSIDTIHDVLLADPTLGATVSTFGYLEVTPPTASEYNGVPTLMIQFILRDVKITSV